MLLFKMGEQFVQREWCNQPLSQSLACLQRMRWGSVRIYALTRSILLNPFVHLLELRLVDSAPQVVHKTEAIAHCEVKYSSPWKVKILFMVAERTQLKG